MLEMLWVMSFGLRILPPRSSPPFAVEALYLDSISIQWILRIVSFKKIKNKKSYNILGGIQQVLKVGKKNLLSISFFIIIKYDH